MTAKEIHDLIVCEKNVISSDYKTLKQDNQHMKANIDLEDKNKNKFRLFIRQSSEFLEDFSIGLLLLKPNAFDENAILVRFQGPHDTLFNPRLGNDLHCVFHSHILSEDDIRNKRFIHPSKKDERSEYESFEEAFEFALKYCNIIGVDRFFKLKENQQIKMNFLSDD